MDIFEYNLLNTFFKWVAMYFFENPRKTFGSTNVVFYRFVTKKNGVL